MLFAHNPAIGAVDRDAIAGLELHRLVRLELPAGGNDRAAVVVQPESVARRMDADVAWRVTAPGIDAYARAELDDQRATTALLAVPAALLLRPVTTAHRRTSRGCAANRVSAFTNNAFVAGHFGGYPEENSLSMPLLIVIFTKIKCPGRDWFLVWGWRNSSANGRRVRSRPPARPTSSWAFGTADLNEFEPELALPTTDDDTGAGRNPVARVRLDDLAVDPDRLIGRFQNDRVGTRPMATASVDRPAADERQNISEAAIKHRHDDSAHRYVPSNRYGARGTPTLHDNNPPCWL